MQGSVPKVNLLQVDTLDSERQPLVRWLQRLEDLFKVLQIEEEIEELQSDLPVL